ncbi:unnamed protein product [Oikopleura dioica]|uniref:Uncharacterized protein n=1 Tax=Oikopleura dioica TaxID=34765 RepID=E4XYE3_OIKDI|nr:unnamed protein product [Oikopleura dioica]
MGSSCRLITRGCTTSVPHAPLFIRPIAMDDLNNVIPLDQNDDVPLDAVEPNADADTDIEDEHDDLDEETDEEDMFLNEFQMDNQDFELPNRTQLLCEVPEQANRGRE